MDLSADRYGGPTKQCLSSSRWVTSSVTDVTTTAALSTVGMLSAKQKRIGCSRCALTSFQVRRSDSLTLGNTPPLACVQPVPQVHDLYTQESEEKERFHKILQRFSKGSTNTKFSLQQCFKAIIFS